jgi:hypothetical protein
VDWKRQRPALALVPEPPPDAPPSGPVISFCSSCGERPDTPPGLESRVCPSCELGLLLHASTDLAPSPGDAFLVLDGSLSVCAVSADAERLLATRETEAVNHHITELLVPAEAEAESSTTLAVAVTWAARGDGQTRRVVVRPANTFGVRLSARIGSCGPPTAALVVFD